MAKCQVGLWPACRPAGGEEVAALRWQWFPSWLRRTARSGRKRDPVRSRQPQRQPESRATRRYQVLLTPQPRSGDTDALAPPPWTDMRAVVRAHHHRTHADQLLTGLVSAEDGAGSAADSQVTATMVVVGPHPDDYLAIGDTFTLWRGADIASGVVTGRL